MIFAMPTDQLKRPLLFPTFLLPSPPKPTSSLNPSLISSSSPSSSPLNTTAANAASGANKYLTDHKSYLQCSTCTAHLCLTSQIISKGFTGRHGRAYLVSCTPSPNSSAESAAVSITPSSSTTASLPNTILQRPVPRQLVTGSHTVSDLSCAFCGTVLGWKYVGAEEESQRYKVGKFILETKKIMGSSCWEGENDSSSQGQDRARAQDMSERNVNEEIEFDSQDEDECEDLFAGIWSAGLASRRRSRKVGGERERERKSTVFGLS